MKIGYWYQILYQEAANGEYYSEETQLNSTDFYLWRIESLDNFKSIFSERKRAFENLEYELITVPGLWLKLWQITIIMLHQRILANSFFRG